MRTETEILELIEALEDRLQLLKAEIRYESGRMSLSEAYSDAGITSCIRRRSNIEGQLSALLWVTGGGNLDQIDALKSRREKLRMQGAHAPVTMESFLPAR
jgi:hypothetical protein